MNENYGGFLPTTQIWDTPATTEGLKSLIVKLYENNNTFAQAINLKESGLYDVNTHVCGKLFFPASAPKPLRPVYRKVIIMGGLPNTGTINKLHGISVDVNTTITSVYGTANNPGVSGIPLPYASPVLNENIALWTDATKVYIKTGKDMTAFTQCNVTIEFLTL